MQVEFLIDDNKNVWFVHARQIQVKFLRMSKEIDLVARQKEASMKRKAEAQEKIL